MNKQQDWSTVFGYRRYRLDNILKDFCTKYYNNETFEFILEIENYLWENINKLIQLQDPFTGQIYGSRSTVVVAGNFIEAKILELLKKEYNAKHEPNGHNTFPDYIIKHENLGDIWIDSKAVLCKYIDTIDQAIPKYSNACGSEAEVCEHILNQYINHNDPFYLSFIIYTYYDEYDNILDIKIVPMIYSINVPDKNWNIEKIRFNIKSRGTDGQIKNSNVTLSLPSFTCKSGMNTLEEQELLIATAASNYLSLKNKK